MGKLFSIRIIELVVNIYDILTLPLYYVLQQPWRVRNQAEKLRAKRVDQNTWVNVDNKLDKTNRRSIDTLDELFRDSVANFSTRKCLGVRKILAVEYKNGNATATTTPKGAPSESPAQVQANGKPTTRVIAKYDMDSKYTWHTYKEIEEIVIKLSASLVNLCNTSLENTDGSRKLLICADTCMQWFLMAHACFRNNVTVVTAYTTLDDDAILHSVHQTEVKILVVCQKFARRVPKIVEQSPLLDTIILLDEPLPGEEDEIHRLKERLLVGDESKSHVKRIISYRDLVARGSELSESISSKPTANDIAVLMYTSGSTGKAKGVMLSHKSIVYTALSFSGPGNIDHEDRYIGYLPLGHVLELAAECIFLRNGSTIAYSSPATLTSSSPMIKRGQHGDAYIFRPTIMGAVPMVLDRVRSAMQQAIKSRGPFWDQLLNDFVVRYKRYWWERYYSTPIMNFLLCRKFNMVLGGKMRAICSGGAALTRETQEYLRHVANFTVLQGYGLTETSAAASFCDIDDRRYNVVGPPYPIVHLKLEDWSDYSVNDKPHPRGEIVIGGQPVSSGYYKMDELTREAFYVDAKTGVRYFRTGDIGLMLPDGVLKIIDRKKDIVKPLSGEYISLSEIERSISTCPIVENICVYCSPFSNYVVALLRPEARELRRQANELFAEQSELGERFRKDLSEAEGWTKAVDGEARQSNGIVSGATSAQVKSELKLISYERLCSNRCLTERILKALQAQASKKGLRRTHIPSRLRLVSEEWSPESGLVTASFKLRRREVEKFYAGVIKELYAELGQNIEQSV